MFGKGRHRPYYTKEGYKHFTSLIALKHEMMDMLRNIVWWQARK